MCQCEDRPCCGHLAEERADAQYWEERAYYGEESYEDEWEDDDESYNDDYEYMTEDAALEYSLFGDC